MPPGVDPTVVPVAPAVPSLRPSQRPSKVDALKSVASGPAATIVAIVTAVSGLFAAVQSYEQSQATARVSYEALRAASETNTARIDACQKGQADLRVWVDELSSRIERRQATTDKRITSKVTKAAATPITSAPVEPAPKAPPVPVAPVSASLPPFDALASRVPVAK